MIKRLEQFRRNSILAFIGFQEALIAIADHANQHVQKVKINLQAEALENQIRKDQVKLGEAIYQRQELDFEDLFKSKGVEELVLNIEMSKKQLDALEGIISPYEALHDFERLLIRSDFIIQHVIILDGFHGIGKTIQELNLPTQMLIFFIKKSDQIEIADGKVIIETKDEITFLCSKENTNKYIELWK